MSCSHYIKVTKVVKWDIKFTLLIHQIFKILERGVLLENPSRTSSDPHMRPLQLTNNANLNTG